MALFVKWACAFTELGQSTSHGTSYIQCKDRERLWESERNRAREWETEGANERVRTEKRKVTKTISLYVVGQVMTSHGQAHQHICCHMNTLYDILYRLLHTVLKCISAELKGKALDLGLDWKIKHWNNRYIYLILRRNTLHIVLCDVFV